MATITIGHHPELTSGRLLVALLAAVLALALLAFGWMLAAGPSQAQSGSMQNCPPAGKWSIAVWEGDSGMAADAALATCGANTVSAAYSLDPQTGAWSRWFAGKPDVSNLSPLNDLQGVLALGAAGGPTVTATPAGTPTPGTGDVTLVSTNSWTTTSSFLIDGEGRSLTVVGELRNDSPTYRSVGQITIRFYDDAGQQVGIRTTGPFDHILRPGGTTAFNEDFPSITYYEGETNDYPDGWTRYEITFSSQDASEDADTLVDMTIDNVQISDDGRNVTGNVMNTSSKTARAYGVTAYVIYRQEDGTILNAAREYLANQNPLGPGESLPFDISVWTGPVDFSSYVAQAYAEAE
jgi:hypothetical protein